MKIIESGNPNACTERWWYGKELKCHACGAVFELEEGDAPKAGDNEHGFGKVVKMPCPTCKTETTGNGY